MLVKSELNQIVQTTRKNDIECWRILIDFKQLKAYSLILNRGRSQKFQNLNFWHLFVAYLQKQNTSTSNYYKNYGSLTHETQGGK